MITYSDIIKLDAERTQGEWQAYHDWVINFFYVSTKEGKEICTSNYNLPESIARHEFNMTSGDAAFIAAMPDAVALLKLYKQLLDRAMQGLEELAKLGYAPEYGNSTGNVIAQQTLAEIRKQLNGDGNG